MASRIMIVEDREMISQAISEMLKLNGFEITAVAEDGRTAVERYGQARPDLVLLDLLLPDISGIEVAGEILQMDPDAVLVAITASTKDGVVEECRDAGIRNLVRKPFRMKELLSVIEETLSITTSG